MSDQIVRSAHAVFGGGCFWCTEAVFEQILGVRDVISGYAGGQAQSADYRQVCTGMTGHAEVIRIEYDPAQVSYDQLLDVFFDAHDPTQLNRQGNDIGTQYRSVIFFSNDSEQSAATAKIAELTAKKKFTKPIVTTLERLVEFYPAENYHQDYARHHPDHPYILFQTMPKVCKIRERHVSIVKTDVDE